MMAVLFPDAETAVVAYLRPALAANGYPTIFISNRRETQTLAVWVRRDGGPTLDGNRDAARMSINCYAAGPTDVNVSALARKVDALMRAAANGAPIIHTRRLSGPAPIPGTVPQRFLMFDVVLRGTNL